MRGLRAKDEEELAEILKVLANPIRIRILELCLRRERSSTELRRILGISKPLLISHVKKLTSLGLLVPRLVIDEKRGILRKYYRTGEWEVCVKREIERLATKVQKMKMEDFNTPHISSGSNSLNDHRRDTSQEAPRRSRHSRTCDIPTIPFHLS